ncbi:hypothetical protein AAHB45_01630 [Pediococcus pentosaceus]|uniref:hypothetical protein n=1 Tax=Pediococcus pentosaceus TaxID=1255 RepID=UPI00315E1668
MEKITNEIDMKISRIDGMIAQLDYIVNDMLDSTEHTLDPNDRFYNLYASNDRIVLERAIPTLDNLREDLGNINKLLNKAYASVSIYEKSK